MVPANANSQTTDLSFTFADIPWSMRDVPRWGVWRMVTREGKPTKIPFSVLSGREASSTNPLDWTDFPTAASYLATRRRHNGLGFRLGDGWAGVDLDGCRDPETGVLAPEAADIIESFGSYCEVSPSQCGVKLFCLGSLPTGRRRTKAPWKPLGGDKAEIEMYDAGRYFTVTGQCIWVPEIAECTPQLAALHERVFSAPLVPQETSGLSAASQRVLDKTDEKLLRVAMAAKNGAQFKSLWDGSIEPHKSHSEADLDLCGRLAFYCGGNVSQIDGLFRRSGLYRDKWDEKHGALTYGEMTIARALSDVRSLYSGGSSGTRQRRVI